MGTCTWGAHVPTANALIPANAVFLYPPADVLTTLQSLVTRTLSRRCPYNSLARNSGLPQSPAPSKSAKQNQDTIRAKHATVRSGKIGRKHPSRDVIVSGQNLAKKCQKSSLYMTSLSLKNKYFWHHVM